MQRRRFLQISALAGAAFLTNRCSGLHKRPSAIQTVTGPLTDDHPGIFLPHEHLFSLFGADITETPQYDREKLFAAVLPYLKSLKQMGCGVIADCTTAYFGRDPLLLKELSQQSGVLVLTNTGLYGAANDRYVPPFAYQESAVELAQRWIREAEQGIEGTGIKPGFIKIGVDDGPLSEIDAKIVRAAALTHLQTGLVIAAHTGNNPTAALQQIEILMQEGVHPGAWIWVHANSVQDREALVRAAKMGAWIEFDGISPTSIDLHLELVKMMQNEGLLNQVLLSHDGNSFRHGDRPAKPYDALFQHFIPVLQQAGFPKKAIQKLTVTQPIRAFHPVIRKV